MENPDQPADAIAVTLSADQWAQLLGMTTQGVSVLLSQLAMQQGGLGQVAQLSTAATTLLSEIRKQVK